MTYKERLIAFNSTEKYAAEMVFMAGLIDAKQGDKIIDFGCGIGTMVKYMQSNTEAMVFGHDIYQYIEPAPSWFRPSIYFVSDKVYFMHSLAHIYNPHKIIETLRLHYLRIGGTVSVITPNADWLAAKNKADGIKSDESVVEHFTMNTLLDLFSAFKVVNYGQFGEYYEGQNERLFIVAKK